MKAAMVSAFATFVVLLAAPLKAEEKPGFLGVRWTDEPKGVRVNRVVPKSPADDAKLQAGDLIVAIDGKNVSGSTVFGDTIRVAKPGTTVELSLVRDGAEAKAIAKLGARPKFSPFLAQDNPPRVDGGSLELGGGERIDGDFGYAGNVILPGGVVTIAGSFEQDWTGLLDVEIDRRADHAALEVSGDVALGGILYVGMTALKPKEHDEFIIIRNAKSLTGEFGKLMLPKLPDGLRWKIVYDDLKNGLDLNRNGRYDVTLLVIKDGSGNDKP